MSDARSGLMVNRPWGARPGGRHGARNRTAKAGRGRLRAGAAATTLAFVLMASLAGCAASPEEIHAREWAMAARADTPQAYETYLRLYPGGPYASVAGQRVAELSTKLLRREL